MFSPYSFMFFITYNFFAMFIFFTEDFFIFWIFMELMMLILMGLSYTLFNSSFSSLIFFFLIQTFSSFLILLFFIFNSAFLFTLAVMAKLALFPFYSWFITCMVSFPSFIFFVSSTIHKIPTILLLWGFTAPLAMNLLIFSLVFSLIFSGFMMLMTKNLKILLIFSSIGNNSWFILSQFSSILVFIIFLFFYSFFLYFILFTNTWIFSFISSPTYIISLFLILISGLPPFPLFFVKILIVSSVMNIFNFFFLFFIILSSVFMASGYMNMVFNLFTNKGLAPSYLYL